MAKTKTRNETERNITGATIKKLRLELGLTQAQLGARMEVQGILWDQKVVSCVELQRRGLYDYELKAVAIALETSVNNLVDMK